MDFVSFSPQYQSVPKPRSLSFFEVQNKSLQCALVECCFTSTETVGLFKFLGTGAQDGHVDFH